MNAAGLADGMGIPTSITADSSACGIGAGGAMASISGASFPCAEAMSAGGSIPVLWATELVVSIDGRASSSSMVRPRELHAARERQARRIAGTPEKRMSTRTQNKLTGGKPVEAPMREMLTANYQEILNRYLTIRENGGRSSPTNPLRTTVPYIRSAGSPSRNRPDRS